MLNSDNKNKNPKVNEKKKQVVEEKYSNLVYKHVAHSQMYIDNRSRYPLEFEKYIVHHVDGDDENNKPHNLMILIPDIASLLERFDKNEIEMLIAELKKMLPNSDSNLGLLVDKESFSVFMEYIRQYLLYSFAGCINTSEFSRYDYHNSNGKYANIIAELYNEMKAYRYFAGRIDGLIRAHLRFALNLSVEEAVKIYEYFNVRRMDIIWKFEKELKELRRNSEFS